MADLFRQVIAEAAPRLVITTGTAGGTLANAQLGDVVITRAAKFRLADEFRNTAFNGKTYRSAGDIPPSQLAAASGLLDVATPRLREPDFGPPTTRYPFGPLLPGFVNSPQLLCDGLDFPEYLPILTTDYFEFGTSSNQLGDEGCGVEMGDAVLGMVADGLGRRAPLAGCAQRVRSTHQRRPANVTVRTGHAGALGRVLLRTVRLLDQCQQRLGMLGAHRSRSTVEMPAVGALNNLAATARSGTTPPNARMLLHFLRRDPRRRTYASTRMWRALCPTERPVTPR